MRCERRGKTDHMGEKSQFSGRKGGERERRLLRCASVRAYGKSSALGIKAAANPRRQSDRVSDLIRGKEHWSGSGLG